MKNKLLEEQEKLQNKFLNNNWTQLKNVVPYNQFNNPQNVYINPHTQTLLKIEIINDLLTITLAKSMANLFSPQRGSNKNNHSIKYALTLEQITNKQTNLVL